MLALPVINFTIDPTEVFDTGLLPHRFQVNDRFRKFEYLLNRCGDCRGFLLGSSRMGYTDPALFDGLLTSGRCYNMNISSANAWDYLEVARYLQRKGIETELLVVQLDITEEFGDRGRYQHHPDFSGDSRFRFFFENLFSIPYRSLLGKLWSNVVGRDSSEFVWETGQRRRADAERMLNEDPDAYVQAESDFRVAADSRRVDSGLFRDAVDQTIGVVRKLRHLADQSRIRIIVLVTPHNQHYLDRFRRVDVLYFLSRLAEVTSFWNFASYSSVTTDDRNYYETSHHRPSIAAMVAARVGGKASGSIPDDFGRWVTRDNAGAVLEELESQFAARIQAGLRSE